MLELIGLSDDAELCTELVYAAGFTKTGIVRGGPVQAGTNADIVNAWLKVLANRNFSIPEGFDKELKSLLGRNFIEYGCIRSFCELESVLNELLDAGLYLGIATSDDSEATMHCLRSLGIEQYFKCILTADMVEHSKPAGDMMDAFVSACGLLPQEVLVVGDSENDMRFAKANGAYGFLFDPRSTSIEHTCADGIIRDLNELHKLISAIDFPNGCEKSCRA